MYFPPVPYTFDSATDRVTLAHNLVINQGSYASPFATDIFIAPPVQLDPTVQTQAQYLQHRIQGNLGGFVHDAAAAELRIYSGSNQGVALNAFEASLVLPSGAHTLTDIRSVTANLVVDASCTGTLTRASMLHAQAVAPLPGGFTLATAVGVYVEPNTVATNNYSIYVAGGNSVIPILTTSATGTVGTIFKGIAGQTAAAWSVQNSGGTTLIQAFADATMGIGGQVSGASLWVNNNIAGDSTVGIIVKAKSTQTGDMQRWQDSSNAVKMRITAGGWPRFTAVTNSSPAEGDLWYDGANLKFRDATTTRTISWT